MPPLVQVQILRTTEGAAAGVARQVPTTAVVATYWARIYRENVRELAANVGQQGTVTQETRTVVVSVRYCDNPGFTGLDTSGNLAVQRNDEIKMLTTAPTEITGQQVWVEVVRPYPTGLQIAVRTGTKAA